MENNIIDYILKKVKQNKNLPYESDVFANHSMHGKRTLYEEYKRNIGKENEDVLTKTALEYMETNEDFLNFAVVNRLIQFTIDLSTSKRDTLNKVEKELFSKNLGMLYDTMEKSGITDILINRHNKLCNQNGISALRVSKEQVSNEFDIEKNTRNTLPLLYMKSLFWINKYIKTFENIESYSLFCKNIGDENITSLNRLELDYLAYMFSLKYELLKNIYKEEITDVKGNKSKNLCKAYKNEYLKAFGDVFPDNENNIFDEYSKVREIEAVKDSLYDRKHMFAGILIKTKLIEIKRSDLNPCAKVWGIRNDDESDKIVFSIEPSGYMLPIALHLPKYIYDDALLALGLSKYEFPKAEPLKRIDNEESVFSTNVLVKPTQEQIAQIKSLSKDKGRKGEFCKRVLEQINGKTHSYTAPEQIRFEIGE